MTILRVSYELFGFNFRLQLQYESNRSVSDESHEVHLPYSALAISLHNMMKDNKE